MVQFKSSRHHPALTCCKVQHPESRSRLREHISAPLHHTPLFPTSIHYQPTSESTKKFQSDVQRNATQINVGGLVDFCFVLIAFPTADEQNRKLREHLIDHGNNCSLQTLTFALRIPVATYHRHPHGGCHNLILLILWKKKCLQKRL